MRLLVAAAAVALGVPGTAFGASLASHSLRPGAPLRAQRFDLVGLHWRGSGTVVFRTRSLTGRWSRWQRGLAEDDRPNGPSGGIRTGSPYWTGGADAVEYRARGRVFGVGALLARSPGGVPMRQPEVANAPAEITRGECGANEATPR